MNPRQVPTSRLGTANGGSVSDRWLFPQRKAINRVFNLNVFPAVGQHALVRKDKQRDCHFVMVGKNCDFAHRPVPPDARRQVLPLRRGDKPSLPAARDPCGNSEPDEKKMRARAAAALRRPHNTKPLVATTTAAHRPVLSTLPKNRLAKYALAHDLSLVFIASQQPVWEPNYPENPPWGCNRGSILIEIGKFFSVSIHSVRGGFPATLRCSEPV